MKLLRKVELILHLIISVFAIVIIVRGFSQVNSGDFDSASTGGFSIVMGFMLLFAANMFLFVIFSIIIAASSAKNIQNTQAANNTQNDTTASTNANTNSNSTQASSLSDELNNIGNNISKTLSNILGNAASNNKPVKKYKYCKYCDSRVDEAVNVCPYCGAHDFTEAKAE